MPRGDYEQGEILIPCPKCRMRISLDASICPHCRSNPWEVDTSKYKLTFKDKVVDWLQDWVIMGILAALGYLVFRIARWILS